MFLSSLIWACDYVDPRYFKEGSEVLVSEWDLDTSFLKSDTITQKQMLLLEEYTGQYCGNCPAAARKAIKLDSIHKERFHIMAIHAGYFADPQNNPVGNDFRCSAGDNLDSKFNVSEAIPKGLLNRNRFGANRIALLSPTAWEGKITEILSKPNPEFLFFLNPFYSEEKQQFYAITHLKFRSAITDSIQVALYLVEDSIVNWQLDYGSSQQEVSNYVHRHMLRDAFSPVGGSENAGSPPYSAGKIATGRWVLSKRPGIVRKNCKVIAIAYKSSNDEILQAVEAEFEDR